MKIKRKILIPIFALVYLMVIFAFADIPPPPVNQNFGVYDTTLMNPADISGQTPIYTEAMCRGCHNTTSSPLIVGGVPTRHHTLVTTGAINPFTGVPFVCQDCHPSTLGTGNGVLLDRNCLDCHNGSAFWGDSVGARVGNFTRPHHNTTNAQARNCKFCHGASVDDYNDNHYIPPYPESEITPGTTFKAYNATSGRVWGGCLACHAENQSATPPIYFTATLPDPVNGRYSSQPTIPNSSRNIHHNEILGITTVNLSAQNQSNQCLWCHVDINDVLAIRGCETCHSVRAIHNTQVDFANTSTLLGFGHIGSNNLSDVQNGSWDCKGCHAWYDAGDVNPFAGAIIPDIQLATPTVFTPNTPTTITLTGTNFVQDNSTTVVNIDDSINLVPDTISNSLITVTVNLAAGDHYIKVVKTDAVENVPKPSNIKSLTVINQVTITSASLKSGVITITGTGFGTKPPNAQQYITVNHAGNIYYSGSVTQWSSTTIKAKNVNAAIGDTVTVITVGGGERSAIIGAGGRTTK